MWSTHWHDKIPCQSCLIAINVRGNICSIILTGGACKNIFFSNIKWLAILLNCWKSFSMLINSVAWSNQGHWNQMRIGISDAHHLQLFQLLHQLSIYIDNEMLVCVKHTQTYSVFSSNVSHVWFHHGWTVNSCATQWHSIYVCTCTSI